MSTVHDPTGGCHRSGARDLVLLANLTYFADWQGHLYRSDGTPAGTFELPAQVEPVDPDWEDSVLFEIGHSESLLYFLGAARQLWRSDGTPGGTFQLTSGLDLDTGYVMAGGVVVAGGRRLFFHAADAAHGIELWTSDGTVAGTRLVRDLLPGPNDGGAGELHALGSRLLFDGTGPSGRALWITDGTAAGTIELAPPVGYRSLVTIGAGYAVFVPQSANGQELWATDGTVAGTGIIRSLPERIAWIAREGGPHHAHFATRTGDGERLWVTDGTAAGPIALATTPAVLSERAVGDSLLLPRVERGGSAEVSLHDAARARNPGSRPHPRRRRRSVAGAGALSRAGGGHCRRRHRRSRALVDRRHDGRDPSARRPLPRSVRLGGTHLVKLVGDDFLVRGRLEPDGAPRLVRIPAGGDPQIVDVPPFRTFAPAIAADHFVAVASGSAAADEVWGFRLTAPCPPAGTTGVTPASLAGFRVWVRLVDPSGASRDGRLEPECLAEAACFSGALPVAWSSWCASSDRNRTVFSGRRW